jgi:serine phosphatase RsbU (regulator of sigma subunit)
MELWTGDFSMESMTSSTGLPAWIFSQPCRGESTGGDVHYLSLCVGGIVARILLADVSGHGVKVDATSSILEKLLRRLMNAKRQDQLVEELNRDFSGLEQSGRFATL